MDVCEHMKARCCLDRAGLVQVARLRPSNSASCGWQHENLTAVSCVAWARVKEIETYAKDIDLRHIESGTEYKHWR